MTDYLTKYRKYILERLEDESCDFSQLLDYHTEKLHQFQHERFIHLLVTVLFALATVMTFIAVAVFETVALIPYIKHYFFLENTVQKLYKDYDCIYRKVYGISQEVEK